MPRSSRPFGLTLRAPPTVRAEVSKPCSVGAASRSCFFLLPAGASGCAPDRAVTFFCFAKRKSPKKRRPCSPVGLGPTALRCSVFAARAELTTRPAAAAFKQPREVRSTKRAARAARKALRCSTAHQGAQEKARLRPRVTPRFASARRSRAHQADAQRGRLVFVSPFGRAEQHRALRGARSAHQQLTSGGCLNAASEARVVSSARPAKTEQRKAALAQRGPRRLGSLLCLTFLSIQESRSAAGPNTRRGLTQ